MSDLEAIAQLAADTDLANYSASSEDAALANLTADERAKVSEMVTTATAALSNKHPSPKNPAPGARDVYEVAAERASAPKSWSVDARDVLNLPRTPCN